MQNVQWREKGKTGEIMMIIMALLGESEWLYFLEFCPFHDLWYSENPDEE